MKADSATALIFDLRPLNFGMSHLMQGQKFNNRGQPLNTNKYKQIQNYIKRSWKAWNGNRLVSESLTQINRSNMYQVEAYKCRQPIHRSPKSGHILCLVRSFYERCLICNCFSIIRMTCDTDYNCDIDNHVLVMTNRWWVRKDQYLSSNLSHTK